MGKKVIQSMKIDVKQVRKTIHKKIAELNRTHKFKYKVREEELRDGFHMEADALNDTIVFDPRHIKELFNHPVFIEQTQINDIEVFVTILLAHEIGHLLDFKKNSFLFYNKGTEEQMELNAWREGKELIPDELYNEYESYKKMSLDHYRRDQFF